VGARGTAYRPRDPLGADGGTLRGRDAAIVGREVEVARLAREIRLGTSVALVGPAGIGKTTLARAGIAGAGLEAFEGAGVDFLQTRPYLPLRRLLGGPPTPGDAAAVAAEVHAALGDSILFLDDLQWADAETVEVLPALAAVAPIVVAVRPGGDTSRRIVKHLEDVGVVVDLGPLPFDAASELARRRLPAHACTAAAELVAAAGANPLAIEVLAQSRSQEGVEGFDTLRAVIDHCAFEARETLARLGLHDLSVDGETKGIAELVERRLVDIDPDGEVRAVAEIFSELALASLPTEARRALHRRCAERASEPGDAALHWAEAGELQKAYAAADQAADRASTPATRAHLLTIAAKTAPPERRWAATRAAVVELLDLGRLDATKPLLKRLEGVEPPTASDAVDRDLMRARLALDEHRPAAVLDITIESLGTHRDVTPEQRYALLVLRAGAKGELFDLPGAMADARAAIELAEASGLSTIRARLVLAVLGVVAGTATWRDELPEVFAECVEGAELAHAVEAGRLYALARFFDCDTAGGVAVCDQLAELARRHNNLRWERDAHGIKAVNLSMTELASPAIVDELRELLADPAVDRTRHEVAVLLALAESDLGNVEAAQAMLREATARALRVRPDNLNDLWWAQAEVAWNAGRLDECADVAHRVLEKSSPVDFGAPAAAVLARWVAWERGEPCAGEPGPLAVFAAQRGLVDEARAVELLATPGREADAAPLFLRAAELHDRYLRRCALRCRWAAGEALRRAGRCADAAEALAAVRVDAAAHGFRPLVARIDASLRQMGAATPAQRPDGRPGRLTPRQSEILTLVKLGLSTAEIASRLHLRPSTVESHIRSAMHRLGASNRREAALSVDGS
jgi:DNA-binding CsgD family transcriptional regulator